MDKTEHSTVNPEQIDINVITTYLPDHSSPEEGHFTFAYTITISNNAEVAVQLLRRHWVITDGDDTVEEVRGDGVVGEQPLIAPAEYFRYTSGTTMRTEVGFMQGSYTMVAVESGETFDVPIPPFSLHLPNALH
jgi:ApaG protein